MGGRGSHICNKTIYGILYLQETYIGWWDPISAENLDGGGGGIPYLQETFMGGGIPYLQEP